MSWIVIGEEKGAIKLVSKSGTGGLLPKGSFLTVESDKGKFILRVDDSRQHEPYSPSPLIVDMDLTPLKHLKNLTILDLSDCMLEEIQVVGELMTIKELDLSDNRVEDISSLSTLKDMVRLDISENLVSDISSIKNLSRLEELNILGNKITKK